MNIIDWAPRVCPHLSVPTPPKKLAENPDAPKWQHEVCCWRAACVEGNTCCRAAPPPDCVAVGKFVDIEEVRAMHDRPAPAFELTMIDARGN